MDSAIDFRNTYPLDSAIHRINYYPMDSAIGFCNTYPLDSAIHRINYYPMDSAIGFCNTYPLDSAIQLLKEKIMSAWLSEDDAVKLDMTLICR